MKIQHLTFPGRVTLTWDEGSKITLLAHQGDLLHPGEIHESLRTWNHRFAQDSAQRPFAFLEPASVRSLIDDMTRAFGVPLPQAYCPTEQP